MHFVVSFVLLFRLLFVSWFCAGAFIVHWLLLFVCLWFIYLGVYCLFVGLLIGLRICLNLFTCGVCCLFVVLLFMFVASCCVVVCLFVLAGVTVVFICGCVCWFLVTYVL